MTKVLLNSIQFNLIGTQLSWHHAVCVYNYFLLFMPLRSLWSIYILLYTAFTSVLHLQPSIVDVELSQLDVKTTWVGE